jgi:5-methylcytosine-specific restriction endonuclease McrA
LCYAPNGEFVCRNKTDAYPWRLAENVGDGADYPGLTKIVLTVHHIDSDKRNSKKQNLIALCQRCHLRLDLQKHMRNRAESKRLAAIGEL